VNRFALPIILMFVSTALLSAQEAKPAVPAALLPWNGVWALQTCEFDGKQQMDEPSKGAIRLSVVGSEHRMYIITDAKAMMGRRLSTSALQADDKAGTFELTIQDGYKKGERVHGIYNIEKDSLKMCYCPADKPRPKDFAAAKGSGVFNEVWTRANTGK